jgi:protein-S-isoprenylcysteine O-methyltransferase Ste14
MRLSQREARRYPAEAMAEDRPDILVFPPLALLAALVLPLLLGWIAPLAVLPWSVVRLLGLVVALAAIGTAASGIRAFHHAGTNVNPRMPALNVVRSGVYRYTRNPMYLGMVGLVAGLGLLLSNGWMLLAAGVLFCVLHWGVVLREERYLEAKFGDAYRALLAGTRRWL